MLKPLLVSLVVALALAGAGCAGKGNKNRPKPAATSTTGTSGANRSTSGIQDPSYAGGSVIGDRSGLDLSERIVYFEYDSSELMPGGRAIVDHFGRFLAENPSARLRLEGHADERGTREYNIGLGERRAISVQAALVAAGASPSQISVVSYGEERPAVPGSDESVWAQNRRVEIIQL